MNLVPGEVMFGHENGRITLLYKLSLSFRLTSHNINSAVVQIEFRDNSGLPLQPVWCRTNQLPDGLRRLASELTPEQATSEVFPAWFLCEYAQEKLTVVWLFGDGFNPKCYPTDDDALTDWINNAR